MALCIAQDAVGSEAAATWPSVGMIVAAPDERAAQKIAAMLKQQRWGAGAVRVVFPVARAVAEARECGAHALFLSAETTLAPAALENAWWALETRPEIGFVAFGDERGATTPMLDACTTCVVVRATHVSEACAASDIRWPGIAPVFSVLEQGKQGHLIREPLVSRSRANRQPDAPLARAIAELRTKGITDAVLGDSGRDAPLSVQPLQLLDERALPDFATPHDEPAFAPPAALAPGKHRVLALLQGFPMGGYSAFNADFLPRLAKRGHALTVCTTEAWRSEWRLDAVRAATPDIVHASGVVALASLPRYVSYLITSRGIDVVLVSHSMVGYRMLSWLRRRHPDTAFLDYVHTDWYEAQMYGSYAALGAAHADWLDAQVASSRTLANDLVQRGARPETTIAQSINLDVTDWDPARFPAAKIRASLGCSAKQPLIMFAGRLSGEKRPLLAVECWRELVATGVDARFAVVGNGPLLGAMMEAVEQAGLKARVEFLGELDGDMLRYVFSAADVYHAPSEIEGIARSLFETMAMQCVPVVADVGGQRELVSDACGKLVPHGAEEVSRYVQALTAAVDGGNMHRMQKAARAQIAQNFTSAQCVEGFEAAFEVAIEQRRASQRAGVPSESHSAARELALSGLETMRRHFWRR